MWFKYQAIGKMVWVFTTGPRDLSSIPGWVTAKTQKMVFDASWLYTQHYKVWIKDKQCNAGKGVVSSPTFHVEAIEKEIFELPSIMVNQLTYIIMFTLSPVILFKSKWCNHTLLLTKLQWEKKLNGNYIEMLHAFFNKSWKQHLSKEHLYDHLPPISQTIQFKHAMHYWRSKDEILINIILMETYGYTGQEKSRFINSRRLTKSNDQ